IRSSIRIAAAPTVPTAISTRGTAARFHVVYQACEAKGLEFHFTQTAVDRRDERCGVVQGKILEAKQLHFELRVADAPDRSFADTEVESARQVAIRLEFAFVVGHNRFYASYGGRF